MKNLLFLSILLFSASAFAQKVDKSTFTLQKETGNIIANYQVIGQLVKTKSDMLGIQKNFSIRATGGEEVIYIKHFQTEEYSSSASSGYKTVENFTFNFIESGAKITIQRNLGLGEKGLMKMLGQELLLNIDGSINMDGVKAFIMKHGGRYVPRQNPNAPKLSEAVVEVNDNLEIWQSGKHLGKVIERHNEEALVYHVYDAKGGKVATAMIDKDDMLEWKVARENGKEYTVLYEGDGSGIQILTYMASEGWFR